MFYLLWMPAKVECSQLIAGAGVDPDVNHQNGIKSPERSWVPQTFLRQWMAMLRTPRLLGQECSLVLVVIHSGKHFRMPVCPRSKSTGGEATRFSLWLDQLIHLVDVKKGEISSVTMSGAVLGFWYSMYQALTIYCSVGKHIDNSNFLYEFRFWWKHPLGQRNLQHFIEICPHCPQEIEPES